MPPEIDADLDAGGGDAGDGSKGPKNGQQGNDDVVPKSQFLAALNSAEQKRERELAALRAEFEAKLERATAQPAKEPQRYTRAQLNAAVAANQITQDAADQAWDDQVRADTIATATTVSTETVTRAQRKERVDSDISRYVALEPDVLVDGSDTRKKVTAEYNFLVSMGDPKTPETELKAMRAALGPIETLELAKSGRSQHDTHRETGGAGGGSGGRKGKSFQDTLTPREKDAYDRMIKLGQYKDWKDVEETMTQYGNPETRRKHGAKV